MQCSIILPIYNEVGALSAVINDLRAADWPSDYQIEVIAVDDGSTDGSSKVLERMVQEWPALRVVSSPRRYGYGKTIRRGLAHAAGDLVAVMDCDGQFAVADLVRLCGLMPGAAVAAGIRSPRCDNAWRRFLGRCGGLLACSIYKVPLSDVNCGLKVFRREILNAVAPRSKGGGIYLEIFSHPVIRTAVIKELAVKHYPRQAGRATGGALLTLLGIWRDALMLLVRIHLPKYPSGSST